MSGCVITTTTKAYQVGNDGWSIKCAGCDTIHTGENFDDAYRTLLCGIPSDACESVFVYYCRESMDKNNDCRATWEDVCRGAENCRDEYDESDDESDDEIVTYIEEMVIDGKKYLWDFAEKTLYDYERWMETEDAVEIGTYDRATDTIRLNDESEKEEVEMKEYNGVMLPRFVDGREVIAYPNAGINPS